MSLATASHTRSEEGARAKKLISGNEKDEKNYNLVGWAAAAAAPSNNKIKNKQTAKDV